MKRWIALVMLLLVLLPGCAPAEKEPRYRVTEVRRCINDELSYLQLYTYHANGRTATETWCHGDGEVQYVTYYTYERDGKNTWCITELEMDGVRSVARKELLNPDGNVLEVWEDYGENGMELTHMSVYDENGNQTFSRSYMGGEPTQTTCWEYDDHGNETREYSYMGDDETDTFWDYKTTYVYDENDRMVEKVFQQSPELNPVTTVYTYTFRENGTLAEKLGVSSMFNTHYVTTYDENGNKLLQGTYSATGRMEEETVWEYDEYGNNVAVENRYANPGGNPPEIYRNEMVYETY